MTKKILIYSGKIKSGKTTNIFRWSASQKNVAGILQPVIDGKRFFYSISDRTIIQLEISIEQAIGLSNGDLIKIGKYNFLKSGFEKAQEILLRDFERDYEWLVIDEIGPLELNNSGLEPAITELLGKRNEFKGLIVIIVRNEILERVIEKYNLTNEYELFEMV